MNVTNLPRCPELPSQAYCMPAGTSHHAFVKVNDEERGVFFMPMLSFTGYDSIRRSCRLVEDGLPDFSTDESGERQCFVWGYANMEDALAVVRHVNNHLNREE
jgi:hypothetical protein